MSTSRSALQLLREEPTLVGAVLHLVAAGLLRSGSGRAAISVTAFEEFAGAPPLARFEDRGPGSVPVIVVNDHEGRWPRVTATSTLVGGTLVVTQRDLIEWLERLASDRSDFAPAVPRALPGGRA